MTSQTPLNEKLYNYVMKCAHCLRILYIKKGVAKTVGIRVGPDYKGCPEHPDKGFLIEWEPL
jgi:hypothetical protein